VSSHHMGDSHYGHSGFDGASQDHYAHGASPQGMGLDDTSLPESRFKIYSDLFEEVIERDRVFGSLLRKIKNSYDFMVMNGMQPQGMPQMPQEATPPHNRSVVENHGVPEGKPAHSYGMAHSNEPTTRADDGVQSWEMQRENKFLKDLVERLHQDLEHAVRNEQRWKQKAVKLKARAESVEAHAQHSVLVNGGHTGEHHSNYPPAPVTAQLWISRVWRDMTGGAFGLNLPQFVGFARRIGQLLLGSADTDDGEEDSPSHLECVLEFVSRGLCGNE